MKGFAVPDIFVFLLSVVFHLNEPTKQLSTFATMKLNLGWKGEI